MLNMRMFAIQHEREGTSDTKRKSEHERFIRNDEGGNVEPKQDCGRDARTESVRSRHM